MISELSGGGSGREKTYVHEEDRRRNLRDRFGREVHALRRIKCSARNDIEKSGQKTYEVGKAAELERLAGGARVVPANEEVDEVVHAVSRDVVAPELDGCQEERRKGELATTHAGKKERRTTHPALPSSRESRRSPPG